jgi:hypothetical protein
MISFLLIVLYNNISNIFLDHKNENKLINLSFLIEYFYKAYFISMNGYFYCVCTLFDFFFENKNFLFKNSS